MTDPAERSDSEIIAEYYATLEQIELLEKFGHPREEGHQAKYRYLSRKSWDMQRDVMWAALREVSRLQKIIEGVNSEQTGSTQAEGREQTAPEDTA